MPGKKFRFPLDNVLKLRQHETETAQLKLAAVNEAVKEQQTQVNLVEKKLDDLTKKTPKSGTSNPVSLRRFDSYRQQVQRAHQEAVVRLEEIRVKEEKAREELLDKRREEESLQLLRDQRKEQHMKDLLSAESQFLDEQSVMRFNRRRPSH